MYLSIESEIALVSQLSLEAIYCLELKKGSSPQLLGAFSILKRPRNFFRVRRIKCKGAFP